MLKVIQYLAQQIAQLIMNNVLSLVFILIYHLLCNFSDDQSIPRNMDYVKEGGTVCEQSHKKEQIIMVSSTIKRR
jgi:hypothetical protein